MKIETKKDGKCRIRLSIEAEAGEISETYGKILGSYMRNSQIRGFRRGKAPREIVLRAYGDGIRDEATSALFRKFVNEAVESKKLDVAAIVGIEEMQFDPEKAMSFVAIVDVNPEFTAPKYKGLPVKYSKPEVKDDAVDAQLKMLREGNARSIETDDPAKDGDYANISFESDFDASGLSEADAKAVERYVKADNFWLQLGEKPYYEAIPGSARELLGKKKGDSFEFTAAYPADFSVEPLRGKSICYRGSVSKVNTSQLPDDETLCKNLGVESIDKIRELLRQRIGESAEAAETRRMEDEIEQYFLKKCSFDVPESMVAQAARACGESVVEQEVRGKNADENYIRDHADELRGKIDERATQLVRLNYIGKALAKELDLAATEHDVRDAVAAQAAVFARQGRKFDADKAFADIRKNGLVPYYQARILYGRVVEWIINNDIKPQAK